MTSKPKAESKGMTSADVMKSYNNFKAALSQTDVQMDDTTRAKVARLQELERIIYQPTSTQSSSGGGVFGMNIGNETRSFVDVGQATQEMERILRELNALDIPDVQPQANQNYGAGLVIR